MGVGLGKWMDTQYPNTRACRPRGTTGCVKPCRVELRAGDVTAGCVCTPWMVGRILVYRNWVSVAQAHCECREWDIVLSLCHRPTKEGELRLFFNRDSIVYSRRSCHYFRAEWTRMWKKASMCSRSPNYRRTFVGVINLR
jgi:hypothetical protein